MTETTDLASLPRETGAEKASTTCANCGTTLQVVESPYGGTSPSACPKCYPATDPKAGANERQQAGAGSSSTPRELGTVTTPQSGGPSA